VTRRNQPSIFTVNETATRGQIRREKLIGEAIRQIAAKGIESVTLESVGTPFRMRRSHVVYYFETMEALVLAAVATTAKTANDLIVGEMARAKSPEGQLLALVDANFIWLRDYADQCVVMFAFLTLCARREDFRREYTRILEGGANRLHTVLPGLLKGKHAPPQMVKTIQDTLTGILIREVTTEVPGSWESRRKNARAQILSLVVDKDV